jgi:hypothetical protein
MFELLQTARPELLITWSIGLLLAIVLLINLIPAKNKSAKIPFKNSKGETKQYIEFVSYKL